MLLAVSLILTGCGDNEDLPETAPVSGKVTLNGQPLTNGTVTFHPEGPGNPGYGEIKEDGAFDLTTYELRDGAVLGLHKVTVEVFDADPEGPPPLPGSEDELSTVPKKYSSPETSPLRFEVKQGTNTAPLPLEL
ncbi:MAG: hypothetical protein RIK87_14540 [Fuerstiella sp.]